jgi:hypothetical protein
MVRWPTSRSRLHPFKAHLSQIERIDKHDNNANRVAIVSEVIEAFGQYGSACSTKASSDSPAESPSHSKTVAILHSQGCSLGLTGPR